MTTTSNYNLSQWAASDPVRRTDFNSDNAKIDAAIHALSDCVRVAVGSYTGTGKYGSANPCTLDFTSTLGRPPRLLVVMPETSNYYWMLAIYGVKVARSYHEQSNPYLMTMTWSGNSVKWYGTHSADTQLNTSGRVYRYIAIG